MGNEEQVTTEGITKIKKVIKKQGKGGIMEWLITIIVAIIVVVAIVFWLSYLNKQDVDDETSMNQDQTAGEIVTDVLTAIAKHMVLPQGEPTIATIEDAANLRQQQSFFALVENGDQLVIFPEQAIIYRPSTDRIVKVGAVQAPAANENRQAVPEVPLTFEIRNGTNETGKASILADQIGTQELYEVLNVGDAGRKDYTSTFVYDLTNGEKSEAVAAFAQIIGSTVTEGYPEGEAESNAEVLVILGLD